MRAHLEPPESPAPVCMQQLGGPSQEREKDWEGKRDAGAIPPLPLPLDPHPLPSPSESSTPPLNSQKGKKNGLKAHPWAHSFPNRLPTSVSLQSGPLCAPHSLLGISKPQSPLSSTLCSLCIQSAGKQGPSWGQLSLRLASSPTQELSLESLVDTLPLLPPEKDCCPLLSSSFL